MTIQPAEAFLSLTLLFGAFVNVKAALGFFRTPAKAAAGLGLTIAVPDNSGGPDATLIFIRLTGACLVGLAMFYLLTALGPLQQVWNVIVAILARLTGVVFYAVTLSKPAGPAAFRKYLALNLGLAVAHAVGLAFSPGGLELLGNTSNTFRWVGNSGTVPE